MVAVIVAVHRRIAVATTVGHRRSPCSLLIVTELTNVAKLLVVDDSLVSGVKTGVFGVEEDDDGVDELAVVGDELVKLIELAEVALDMVELDEQISLTKEFEIKEELEAIKLESKETCGKGVGEGEGLGDGVEEVLPTG
ncbi:hypothetical protein EDB89DRAFT_1915640 [Lactarius sanguifluus]|nr:hypothetical protein EDB89DRAFT_1915640 [Lactarius sanguifluus]